MRKVITLIFVAMIPFLVKAKIKVLIIDGQNNHEVWPKSTIMMKQYLEESGLFRVDIYRSNYTWKGKREEQYLSLANTGTTVDLTEPKSDNKFNPPFSKYDVVISNFGWQAANWPKGTQRAFEKYVASGGGFVVIHAADNSFPEWKAYNQMIGLGGWGGRNEKDGPYVYYTNSGELVRDNSAGSSGAHGRPHNIPITIRQSDHPIVKGMPLEWLTAVDECYAKLRGPAENMTILATGKDISANAPTDRQEPVLMVINYGKGRVFHNILGHDDYSFEGVGFITCLIRGVEWAATGQVTSDIPHDFPTAKKSSCRPFILKD